jgi:hypothetical protein
MIVSNGYRDNQIIVLVDDSSTKMYINADVAIELGLAGEQENGSMHILNGRSDVFKTVANNV